MTSISVTVDDLKRVANALQIPLSTLISLLLNLPEDDAFGAADVVAHPRLLSVVPADLEEILREIR